MVQVSIGEKGVVQWENSALQGHAVEKGTILEFEVCAEPEEGGGCNSVKVNVSVYCHVDGCRVLGTSGSFVTEKQRITLSCYCYARGQGWRVVS
ncbi:hypothetical protein DIPPA_28341 [Diplonema papillatum]|nr:hypothetical protein DIPPA_28341 [Diplonema papillatum]